MFDMSNLVPRYFEIKLPNGMYLEVEPPRMKALKKIMALSEVDRGSLDVNNIDEMLQGLSLALSKNKQKKKVPVELLSDMLDINMITELLTAYFEWVGEIQDSKN